MNHHGAGCRLSADARVRPVRRTCASRIADHRGGHRSGAVQASPRRSGARMGRHRSLLTAASLPLALFTGALIAACGGTATTRSSVGVAATAPHAKPRAAASSPRLYASASLRLPAPVRNPATTALGGRAILMGGLDQAIASSADVVVADQRGSRLVAQLPYPVHDAAAATLGGRAYLLGGGEPSRDEILAVDPTGRAAVAGRLPAPASDVAAATIGQEVYVVGAIRERHRWTRSWPGAGPGWARSSRRFRTPFATRR